MLQNYMEIIPNQENNLRKQETDISMTKQPIKIKKPSLYADSLIFKKQYSINYSTTTIPLAVKRISLWGLVIASISSLVFLASSA